jgi:hypothetical protein
VAQAIEPVPPACVTTNFVAELCKLRIGRPRLVRPRAEVENLRYKGRPGEFSP